MKSTLESPQPASPPMVPHPWSVRRLWWETDDTFTFELTPEAARTFKFLPGQFNMLYAFGIGEIPISISGDPNDSKRLTHTVRAVGAVSSGLGKLKRGNQIGVRGPFGSHWPVHEAAGRDLLIIAGGIGLAPLRPALYAALNSRRQLGKLSLLYGTRSANDILYPKELAHWAEREDFQTLVTVDRAGADWKGNVGVVTTLIGKADFDPGKVIAMICGPEIMMRFSIRELQKRGVSDDRIYISMERNMKCAIGFCGHCQFGPTFICKDGAVFRYDRVRHLLAIQEL